MHLSRVIVLCLFVFHIRLCWMQLYFLQFCKSTQKCNRKHNNTKGMLYERWKSWLWWIKCWGCWGDWMNVTIILLITGCLLFLLLITNVFTGCRYEMVCHINSSLQSKTFDCNIIYSRVKNPTIAEIEKVACSDEVLSILEKQFNTTLDRKNCRYFCCLTDGTCINGIAVNHQGYYWGD